jgi:two-component system sensor histidine kinase KdpD
MLLLSRLELGKEPVKTRVAVQRVVSAAENDLLRGYPEREVIVSCAEDADYVLSDETSLRQVLYNLLSNAAKYSPPTAPIEIAVGQDGSNVAFRVLDRGPGVPAEELNLIFESFYRSPNTARQAQGKGIGLAVCRRLIESLGGRIWAQPRPGGGLEVAFAVPSGVERSLNEPDLVVPG